MQDQLIAMVYAQLGALLGYIFSRFLFSEKELERFFFVWVIITVALFTFSDPFAFFGLTGFIIFVARPRRIEEWIPFYILCLHMVPDSVGFDLPFPGLNYLIFVDFAKISAAVILLPLWFASRAKRRNEPANRKLDFAVIAYYILVSFLTYRSYSVTSVARAFVDNGLLILLPYFAIQAAISNFADIQKIIRYWIVVCLILAFVALISEFKFWNIYTAISDGLLVEGLMSFGYSEIRTGILRTSATLAPAALGFALSLGIVFAQYIKAHTGVNKATLRIVQGIFLTALYFTYARGSWLSLIVMSTLYLLFFLRSASARYLIRSAIVAGLFLLALSVGAGDLFRLDQFGTFQYRYDLIINSWEVIKQNPLLGSVTYSENNALEASIQGQGIVDIVNAYLRVTLRAGLVGLTLFVLIITLPIIRLRKMARRLDIAELKVERDICYLMIIIIAGMAVLLGTISMIGVLPKYLFMFVALAAGTARIAQKALTALQIERAASDNQLDISE